MLQAQNELVSISIPAFNTTEDASTPFVSVAVALHSPHSHAPVAFVPTPVIPVAKVCCGQSVVGFHHSPAGSALPETKTVVVLSATTFTDPFYVPVISTSMTVALSIADFAQSFTTSPGFVSKPVPFAELPSAAFIQPTFAPVISVSFSLPTFPFPTLTNLLIVGPRRLQNLFATETLPPRQSLSRLRCISPSRTPTMAVLMV